MKTKLILPLLTFSILLLTPISLLASPSEPERYDPVEYSNQGANTYEMMDKAKELAGLLEARMEHLVKLKMEDAKNTEVVQGQGCAITTLTATN